MANNTTNGSLVAVDLFPLDKNNYNNIIAVVFLSLSSHSFLFFALGSVVSKSIVNMQLKQC